MVTNWLKKYQDWLMLSLIFLLAAIIRFLYFPNNIYFSFDQARDAFVVADLLHGKLRLIGPSTLVAGLFHGPLYYYLFAPFYFFSDGNPEWVSAFLRTVNAGGVITVFLLVKNLFEKKTAFLAAFLYSISFEQTQFAIYLNHPSLGVQAVLLFYLGLTYLFFQKKWWGLLIALIGLGLSIQFEFVLTYLIVGFLGQLGILGILGKKLPKLKLWQIGISLGAFILTVSTFILAEIKYHFRGVETLFSQVLVVDPSSVKANFLNNVYVIFTRYIGDSVFNWGAIVVGIALVLIAVGMIRYNQNRWQTILLSIWFMTGFIPYIKNTASIPLYYYSEGTAISFVIFVAFLLTKIAQKYIWITAIFLSLIIVSNIYLINQYNSKGTLPSINTQSGMLYSDEKKVVDYIYQDAQGQPLSVNALSIPLNVNIVWSYVFEQYGQKKYGYLPIWGGDAAEGYAGHLTVEKARSKLPDKQYLILEPTRGLPQYLIDDFLTQENYFSTASGQMQFGQIRLERRTPL